MAINLLHRYSAEPNREKSEPIKRSPLITPFAKRLLRFGFYFSAGMSLYLIVFSTIIEREIERSLMNEAYDAALIMANRLKNEQRAVPLDTVAEEKILAAEPDEALASRLSGYILLQVEKNGEAWYVYPPDKKKYYLGRPEQAARVMRVLGLGVDKKTIDNFQILSADLTGRILLDIERDGDAYYVYPADRKIYRLGRPEEAAQVIRDFGRGVTNEEIRRIAIGEID